MVFQVLFWTGVPTLWTAEPQLDSLEGWTNSLGMATGSVTGVIPWIHHTRVKKAGTSCDEDTWKAVQDPENLHKLQFQKQQRSPMKDTEPRFSHSES